MGAEFQIDNLEDMCRAMCDNVVPEQQEVGFWKFNTRYDVYGCSECGAFYDVPAPRCPNCGAVMLEGVKHDRH